MLLRSAAGLVLLACLHSAGAEPVLRLVSPTPLDNPMTQHLREILDTAAGRAGIGISLTYNPPARALMAFKSGQFDGDIARARNFNDEMPEAVRVEPALTYGEFLAVTTSETLHPRSWRDLKPYRIAYMRGAKAVESNTREVAAREVVGSYEACVGMAKLGRVDACVGLASVLSLVPELRDPSLRIVRFEREASYLWLAPQHRELAQRLGKVLQKMESQGLLRVPATLSAGGH
ncbi:ABC transporter substrate-binding protein [Massilia sp. TS11]|uniref:substrate-binding periplasmic protein n=1 Tax=Massilia sp. TS11 TaxID=2908003 RepID=UPI001EDA9965|nr:transporter substrate-binding domain-containing protein [Massilia sp. TS11]MCG2583499.1 transporter substrate-binding domain-containing protein [Massilia sp. TS11]